MNFSCSGWKCRTPWRIVLQVLGGYCVGKLASERQQKAIIIIVKAQSVQFSCSVVSDSATPWTAARQASLSITSSQSLLKLMSIIGDAIQPSHPLSFPSSLAFNLSQHQGLFQGVSSSHLVAKVLELQLQHQSFPLMNI